MIINQNHAVASWKNPTGLVDGASVYEGWTEYIFPVHFYTFDQGNVLGLMKRGDVVHINKFFTTTVEAIKRVKESNPDSLPPLEEGKEILFDVARQAVVTSKDFRDLFPRRKDDPNLLAMSDADSSKLWLLAGAMSTGLIATLNFTSIFYDKPAGEEFTVASKKFLYHWVCKTFNFPMDEKMSLTTVNFPSMISEKPMVQKPSNENLSYLLNISMNILKEESKLLADQMSGNYKESLAGYLADCGIDEDSIAMSRIAPVEIEIDVEEFNYIVSATLDRGGLEVRYANTVNHGEVNKFLMALNWKGPTSYFINSTTVMED